MIITGKIPKGQEEATFVCTNFELAVPTPDDSRMLSWMQVGESTRLKRLWGSPMPPPSSL